MSDRFVIGLSGLIGSGKNSVGLVLIEHYGFTKLAFADSLKDVLASVFGWDRELLEGETSESRAWRNIVDPWWSAVLGIEDFSPRKAMQLVGTDVFRTFLHPDIWVKSLVRKVELSENKKIVVTDCRFFNELNAVKSLGGSLVRVKKGTDPDWFRYAIERNTGTNISIQKAAGQKLAELEVHASEYSWVGYGFDSVINNNGTLEDLENTTHQLVSHLASTLAHSEQSLQRNSNTQFED